jgi:GST-like protein
MLYLAEKTGKLLPRNLRRRSLAQQWLIWQVSGLGPMHGQAHHFVRYAPEGQTYAVERYTKEARRQLNVLEYRLREAEYLAEEFSIADLAVFPWVQGAHLIGFDLKVFPAISAWSQKVLQRPAVQKALNIPELKVPDHYVRGRAGLNAQEWSNLFGDRMHAATELYGEGK